MPALACLWARPRVERHVDGALGPRNARFVESHLGSCGECLARAEAARRMRGRVNASAISVSEPDWSGFWPGVRARILREAPRPVRDAWWLAFWRPFWGHPRLSLGGALAAEDLLQAGIEPVGEPACHVHGAQRVLEAAVLPGREDPEAGLNLVHAA